MEETLLFSKVTGYLALLLGMYCIMLGIFSRYRYLPVFLSKPERSKLLGKLMKTRRLVGIVAFGFADFHLDMIL